MSTHGRSSSSGSLMRPLLLTALLSLLLAGLATAYIGWNVLNGARDLHAAATTLERAVLLSDQERRPDQLLRDAAERTRAARQRLQDPILQLAASLPFVGAPLRTSSALAVSADAAVGGALLPLASAAGEAPQERLVSDRGAVDLSLLRSLREPAERAEETLRSAISTAAASPSETGISRIDDARTDLLDELHRLNALVADVALAADVGPRLLGADGPKRYLLVAQNPAEARGTGGLVGGYAIVQAEVGQLWLLDSGSNRELVAFRGGPPSVELGQEFEEHYAHNLPTGAWVNSNLSPHFPYAARIWRALWERQSGEQVDGVLTLDPLALSYLLGATGDVRVDDGTIVTAENVVELTLRDAYADFDGANSERKEYLVEVMEAVAARLTTGDVDLKRALPALGRATNERRLLLWTDNPEIDDPLFDQPIAARLPNDRPVIGDVVVNAAGSKLDYYLDRALTWQARCDGTATLSLRLHNDAPPSGLPEYVSVPQFREGLPPGTNKSLVTLYVPGDGAVTQVRQDGRPIQARQGSELGSRWIEFLVVLRPDQSAVLEVDVVREQGNDRVPYRWEQPLVRDESFTATVCEAG